jgi:hypothetical protein
MPWKRNITFPFIGLRVDVAVSNVKVFSVAVEMQHGVPFALLLSYKIFGTIF